MNKKIRVLIVDDSSVIRALLTQFLSSDPTIEVVATASDPYVAREKITELRPDVMTLDIEMPRMDGITFLAKVMEHFPVRTLIISSLSKKGSANALRALELGAIDVLPKPALDVTQTLQGLRQEIINRVKMVANARLRTSFAAKLKLPTTSEMRPLDNTTHKVVAIASSTGGIEALKIILPHLPSNLPGTLIVQHMPPVFTKTYAAHLQQLCKFEVKEAVDGDRILPGRVIIAPGDHHMEITRNGAYYYVALHQRPLLHGVRPAADYLMHSVAKNAGANAIGVVLTGMGKDGAEGLLAMKKAGSFNIAQDEQTSVIYGMPKAAIECGAIDKICALEKIAFEIIRQFEIASAA